MEAETKKTHTCWRCPEQFERLQELKTHAITTHQACRLICPWCCKEEVTFSRMSELTKHSKKKHQDLVTDLENTEFFTEKNGFYLALKPEDYSRMVTPNDWASTIAIRTRAAVLGWAERLKDRTSRPKEEWEKGWKHVQGIPMSPLPVRKRKYSPSRPGMETPLVICSISLSTAGNYAILKASDESSEVWYKAELAHWVMEDKKAMDNLTRRMASCHRKNMQGAPKEFVVELHEAADTTINIASTLGISIKTIRKVFRSALKLQLREKPKEMQKPKSCQEDSFLKPERSENEECSDKKKKTTDEPTCIMDNQEDIGEDPQVEVNDVQHTQEPDLSKSRPQDEHHSQCPTPTKVINQEDVRIVEIETETSEEETIEEPTYTAEPLTTKLRAELLLKTGGMPLFPPARRQWDMVTKKFTISEHPTRMQWPPADWEKMSPEEKLTSWRFSAYTLAREEGITSCKNERDILDSFSMLALPGTQIPAFKGEDRIVRARLANFNILKDICLGNLTGSVAESWVEALEQTTKGRTPRLTRTIQTVPLRLTTEDQN